MAFGAHDSFKNCVIMAKITINFTFQIGKMKANEILYKAMVTQALVMTVSFPCCAIMRKEK